MTANSQQHNSLTQNNDLVGLEEQVHQQEGTNMAKGMKCRLCQSPMYAESEDNQPKGRWVVYVCRSSRCPDSVATDGRYPNKEKVFEDYPYS